MINLLPKELKVNLTYARTNRSLLQVLLYTLCLFEVIFIIYVYQYNFLNRELTSAKNIYESKNASMAKDTVNTEAQKLSTRIATAATLLKREVKFSRFIKQIGSLMPSGAYLSNLNVTNDTKQPLQIEAVVVTESQGLVLKKNIDDITDDKGKKIFVGADIQSITATKVIINNKEEQRFIVRITTAFSDSVTLSMQPSQDVLGFNNSLIGENKL